MYVSIFPLECRDDYVWFLLCFSMLRLPFFVVNSIYLGVVSEAKLT